MLTTDKILAHKVNGKNLILLTQVEQAYFVVVGHVSRGFLRKASFQILAQKQISFAEAIELYARLTGSSYYGSAHADAAQLPETASQGADQASAASTEKFVSEILLLEQPIKRSAPRVVIAAQRPTPSPYFPTKDIFLSVQKTRAPANRI